MSSADKEGKHIRLRTEEKNRKIIKDERDRSLIQIDSRMAVIVLGETHLNDNEPGKLLNKQNQISQILSSTTLYPIKNPLHQLIKHLFPLADFSCRLVKGGE